MPNNVFVKTFSNIDSVLARDSINLALVFLFQTQQSQHIIIPKKSNFHCKEKNQTPNIGCNLQKNYSTKYFC